MGTAFMIVWGIALLVIAVLLAVLVFTLKRSPRQAALAVEDTSVGFAPTQDMLLFYYEQESIRSTVDGNVIVRIRSTSWGAEWENDLLRLEVNALDPKDVKLTAEWCNAQVIAVYDFRAYRMTEMGTDVAVTSFIAPIEIILMTTETDSDLTILLQADETWVSVPEIDISAKELAGTRSLGGQEWSAASVSKLGRLCLIKY